MFPTSAANFLNVPHNDAMYLIDAQGRERVLMDSSAPETLAKNLQILLGARKEIE